MVRNTTALTRSAALFGDSTIYPNSMPGGMTGGPVTQANGALAISTVLNCMRVIHDDLTTLPFYAYTGDRHGVRIPMHDQPRLVVEPFGPHLSTQAGMGQIAVSVKMRGNAYLWVAEYDRDGFPVMLQVLPPDRVTVDRDSDGRKRFRIGSNYYTPEQVKHVTGLMLPGAVAGIDPLSYQRLTNQLAVDVNTYGANFFANGGAPGGVIEIKGNGDRKKAREIKEAWESGHSGVTNAHRPAVLFNGTYNPVTIAPENAQFLQTRAFLREEIAGWYGVPLARINAAGAERVPTASGGIEGIDDEYAKHTLLPLTISIESVWDSMLPGNQATWTNFDFAGLLRASALSRATIAQVHRVTAVRSPDEIRADEGWAPIPEGKGEDFFTPLNSNTSGTPPGNHNDPSVKDGQANGSGS